MHVRMSSFTSMCGMLRCTYMLYMPSPLSCITTGATYMHAVSLSLPLPLALSLFVSLSLDKPALSLDKPVEGKDFRAKTFAGFMLVYALAEIRPATLRTGTTQSQPDCVPHNLPMQARSGNNSRVL